MKEALFWTIEGQSRFEAWAKEDEPVIIEPGSFFTGQYQDSDLPGLVAIYVAAFNSQNKQLYTRQEGAILAWDEEPWTETSARNQLESELSAPSKICFVSRAEIVRSPLGPEGRQPVGFIIARPVYLDGLAEVCGSKEIAQAMFATAVEPDKLLLWEDAAVFNLRTPTQKTIRGVGSRLYKRLALAADILDFVSVGRTAPGSFAPRIMPKIGFEQPNPPIADGKDPGRYWLLRFPQTI